MPSLFARALQKIVGQKPDFLAVTGDLLDVPDWLESPPAGFCRDVPEYWCEAALEDYRQIKSWLDATGLPYQVVPGNHDLPAAFWRVFDASCHVHELPGVRFVRFCDHEHEGHRPRRFTPERDRWEASLAEGKGAKQVHLQHYVVTPDLNEGYPHTYEEGQDLARRMNASGCVALSLSGHFHPGTKLQHHGSTTFATTPAFCESPFRWRIYHLALPSGEVTMEEHELGAPPLRPVVFLDRDGVINDSPSYSTGPEAMRLLPGSAAAIRALREAGFLTVVITNQTAIGLGYVPEEVVHCVNDKMARLLAEEGAVLDAIYYTAAAGGEAVLPRYGDKTQAKPSPHLLLKAGAELGLDFSRAWMIGDNSTDIAAGQAAGVRTILVETGHGAGVALKVRQRWPEVPVVSDLRAAATMILE
jgi:D-glycero-D-manno-heptose 1,7-bisphosphate phosphatase